MILQMGQIFLRARARFQAQWEGGKNIGGISEVLESLQPSLWYHWIKTETGNWMMPGLANMIV